MNPARPTCVLLMSAHAHLADAAEDHCGRHLEILYSTRRSRRDNAVPGELRELAAAGKIDYLLNFLSPIIIPGEILSASRVDSINFHPAPPEWPGVGSASYALYHGDATFGVTAHQMLPKVDSGAIYHVLRFPITSADDCGSVFRRATEYALIQFYDIVDQIARGDALRPSGDTWKRQAIRRSEFEQWMTLTPETPPDELERKIAAVRHPQYPGPFLKFGDHVFELPPRAKKRA